MEDSSEEYGMEFDADEWYWEADLEEDREFDYEDEEEEEDQEVINVQTALDLLETELKPINLPLVTFCKALDVTIHGGFEMGMLTELHGNKGLGKTTFCLQLCLNVQIPESIEGHAAESIYIDTEGSFCLKRMKVMARRFAEHLRKVTPDFKLSVKKLLNAVHYIGCDSVLDLEKILEGLHEYLKTRKVKLIVIDSLAFVYYECEGNFEDRVTKMYGVCQQLYSLMSKYSLAVVVTNNLTTRFYRNGRKYYIPYLGESFTFLPHTRINLTRSGKLRKAVIAKSFKGCSIQSYYKVTSFGIRD